MEKHGRLKRLSRQLLELLRDVPDKIEVETGLELLPVTKVFIKIRILSSSLKKQAETKNEGQRKNVRRLHNNAKGACKQDET